jgi:hypothetical protein
VMKRHRLKCRRWLRLSLLFSEKWACLPTELLLE